MSSTYFITATGTDIGKTLVTCALAYQLQAKGKTLRVIKPVASGFDAQHVAGSDTGRLLQAQGIAISSDAVARTTPWRFAAPLSPDMAAACEGRAVDFAALTAFCNAPSTAEYTLIEGAGGVMAPLDETHTVLDWMAALACPVILVAGSYLGSISHTLSAVEALKAKGSRLHALILSESEISVPASALLATLRRFLPEVKIHWISRLDSSPEVWKTMPDLTQIIL